MIGREVYIHMLEERGVIKGFDAADGVFYIVKMEDGAIAYAPVWSVEVLQ